MNHYQIFVPKEVNDASQVADRLFKKLAILEDALDLSYSSLTYSLEGMKHRLSTDCGTTVF